MKQHGQCGAQQRISSRSTRLLLGMVTPCSFRETPTVAITLFANIIKRLVSHTQQFNFMAETLLSSGACVERKIGCSQQQQPEREKIPISSAKTRDALKEHHLHQRTVPRFVAALAPIPGFTHKVVISAHAQFHKRPFTHTDAHCACVEDSSRLLYNFFDKSANKNISTAYI